MMTIDVRTNVYPEGLIVTEVIDDIGTYRERIVRQVLNTKEQQVREALIKLGWTPPEGATTDSASRAHAFGG